MEKKEKKEKLGKIAKEVVSCQRCPLYKSATQGVAGEGDPKAEIMFIGEGPGFYEDQQGRPFVGQAGKLLDKLLQSIKLERKDVFITNVLKHRAPSNRDPLPGEIEACREWLDRQIEIINPRIIVTLGRFSMTKFIPRGFISQTHGQARFAEFGGEKIIVIPMYHPAAALRRLEIMDRLKEDFQKIRQYLSNQENLEEKEVKEEREQPKEEEQLSLIN